MSIRKFIIGFSVLFSLVTAATAVVLMVETSRMNEMAIHIGNSVESVRAGEELQVSLLHHNLILHDETLGDIEKAAQLASQTRRIKFWLAKTKVHISNAYEATLVGDLERTSEVYLRSNNKGPSVDARQAFNSANDLAEQLIETNVETSRETQEKAYAANRLANVLGIAVTSFCLITLIAAWVAIRRWVYEPVRSLRRRIDTFNAHDRKDETPFKGPVEFQAVADAFDELSSRLRVQRDSQLQFLASVAHDLRNPLSAIRMSSQLLLDDGTSSEDSKPIVEIIGRQAQLLDRMVGDLLDSSRIESGHLELQQSPQCLNRLVEDAIVLHRSVSPIHTLHFTAGSGSEAKKVFSNCDPLRISQVLNNLLSNAIKYSPNGGRIEVTLEALDGIARIQVKDEGFGIAESDIHQIFEPFRRTKLTKLVIPGVGLGLSVTKRILEAHGGSISVKSVVGEGSVFTIRLPSIPLPLIPVKSTSRERGDGAASDAPYLHS